MIEEHLFCTSWVPESTQIQFLQLGKTCASALGKLLVARESRPALDGSVVRLGIRQLFFVDQNVSFVEVL